MSALAAPSPAPLPPMQGSARTLAALAVSLGTFLNVLDTTIANVSIPAIAGDLGVSVSQGTWVITSFAVSNAIFVPLTGWLTQRFGAVKLFSLSVLLFTLASFLCGLASSIEMLIACRVLQGMDISMLLARPHKNEARVNNNTESENNLTAPKR